MDKTFYLLLVCSLLAIGSLSQCHTKHEGINEIDLRKLKDTYSVEAINYFYETVFYQDNVGVRDTALKWEKDIWIQIEGTLWPNDSLYVRDAVEELNNLNLPIKLHITNDTAVVNMKVYFGDCDYLKEKVARLPERALGGGFSTETTSIQSASVAITNNAPRYYRSFVDSTQFRKAVILEEITQGLGVIGDSWLNYHSLFFEGMAMKNLTEIDKEVIRLLYEPVIPAKLARSDFEVYFKDELYTVNPKQKLVDYVKANNVPKRYLEVIRDNSFHDSTLFKYPKQVFVKLEGDYQDADLEFCQRAVNLLNTVSDQLHLEIVDDNIWNQLPSVTIQYNDSLQTPFRAERFLTVGGARMIPRRLKGRVKLTYGEPGIDQEGIDKMNPGVNLILLRCQERDQKQC